MAHGRVRRKPSYYQGKSTVPVDTVSGVKRVSPVDLLKGGGRRGPLPGERDANGEGNMARQMSIDELTDAFDLVLQRFKSAESTTIEIAEKMVKWEKQYQGEWQDSDNDNKDHVFLTKSREQLHTVHAYLLMLVSQLPQLVTFRPMVRSLSAYSDEYKRAKIAEALVNFYLEDAWRFKEDILPRWLKLFLKHSTAVIKVCYEEKDSEPDLRFDIVDRATLYIDPFASDIRTAGWLIEKEYLSRMEVEARFELGYWSMPKEWEFDSIPGINSGELPPEMQRLRGKTHENSAPLWEDELIEVWHKWQAPTNGQVDMYIVVVGGEQGRIVRYGRNPYPYKGIPYRAKSYDQNEWGVDGNGLLEMYRSVQEVLNTVYNLRVDDILANTHAPVATDEEFVNATTQEDFAERRKLVRLDSAAVQAARQTNPNFKLSDAFAPLPIGTSTGELFNDLNWILAQGKEASNVGDVFAGRSPGKTSTLGEVQEVLSRNQGTFLPPFKQMLRMVEEVAEIALEYFKDERFFGEERIIQVIGNDRYKDSITDWHVQHGKTKLRSVTPDEMDVDVTIVATNAADALQSRTMQASLISSTIAEIGQVPGIGEQIAQKINFPKLFTERLAQSGMDSESYTYTDEEQQQLAQQQQQAQQSQMQQQMQMLQMQEQAKAQAKTEGQLAIEQAKGQTTSQIEQMRGDVRMEEVVAKITAQHHADMQKMQQEQFHAIQRMLMEFQLEMKAQQAGIQAKVGTEGNNINTPAPAGSSKRKPKRTK